MSLGSFLGGLAGPLISGLFGKKAKPQTSTSLSGWQALPEELRNVYLQNFLPDILKQQQAGPNAYQQQATNSLGGGIDALRNELPDYMNPYQDAVTKRVVAEMQQDAQGERDRILSEAAGNGLGGLFSSSLTKQLDRLNDNTLNRIGSYRDYSANQNYNQALGLRKQTIADMLTAGDMPYENLSKFGSLLGMFPGGSTTSNVGATQGSNWANKLGGALITAQGAAKQEGGWSRLLPFDLAYDLTGGRPWMLD